MQDVLDVARRALGAILLVDEQRRIRYCNREAGEVLGIEPARIEGDPCFSTLAGDDAFGNRFCNPGCAIFQMAEQGLTPRPFELRVKNGRRVRLDPLPIRVVGKGVVVLYQLRQTRQASAMEANHATDERLRQLSQREREVLSLLTEGLETEVIAARLGISRTTVRNHVQRILRKLGVHSKLEAVAYALRQRE